MRMMRGISPPCVRLRVQLRRVVNRDFVARVRYVDPGLDGVRVNVRAFVEDRRVVDGDPDDVVALRDAGDVDPLAAELLVIPVAPTRRDPLILARVPGALAPVVLEGVLEAEALLVAGDD